jgi:tetratricopeptide (TPR) repeat protein
MKYAFGWGQKAGEPVKTFKGLDVKKLGLLLSGIIFINLSLVQADQALVDLAKKVKPCVVLIETFDKDNKPLAQGSGFFVNNKGHIVTNHHVLEGAYRATVKTSSGMEYPVEGVIAKNTEADIVKLVVNIPATNITFLNLSEIVPSEGQDIVVIGNPLGLESTVSAGIVSAVRDIPAFGKILQITAPISPGSSGSPVVDMKGEVIGIATFVFKKGQNLNFAIPSDKIIALTETSQTPIFDAMTADSSDAQLFIQRGLKEVWQKNYVAALAYFQKAKEKNPQDADVWFYLGVCYSELGRYQDAIESYKQTIRIKPDYADAHYNLGNAYGILGRYEDAVESYKQVIRINPDLAEAHNNLGGAYFKLGRYQDAVESYKQAIIINPNYAEAHFLLGSAYGKLDRYEDAIESNKQAIRINPNYAEAYLGLAGDYGDLGLYQDSIEALKQVIRIKPDYADVHFLLGVSYLIVGDKGSALEEYKILKTLDTEQANELFSSIYK